MHNDGETVGIPSGGALLERMLARGWEFDFFQAAWLLERHCSDRLSIGGRGPVGQEAIRLRPHVSLGFPSTDVRRITKCDEPAGLPFYRLDVTFLGLYGVSTPLPLHYAIEVLRAVDRQQSPSTTESQPIAADREQVPDSESESSPTRDFLDILHHRLLSLFYRSWTKYRYDVSFGLPERDSITGYLLNLIGCPPTPDESVLGVPPIRLIRYAGNLTQHPTSAVALEGVLSDYWEGIEIHVQQFVGRWVPLSPDDMNRTGLARSSLGSDLIVGEQVYDLNGAFNVTLGPVDWETYLRFLPDGECFVQTRSLVRISCSDPLAFTLEVKLQAGEVPEMQLWSDDRAARLGYTSWVRTDELSETSVVFDATSESPSQEGAAAAVAPTCQMVST